MKRSVKDLLKFSIQSKDGTRVDVKDFLFDDESWTVRYLEVDLGNIINSERVLIPQVLLKDVHWDEKLFFTDMTRADIEKGPRTDENMPISRRYEEELNKHYSLMDYWTSFYPLPGMGTATGSVYPNRPIRVPSKVIDVNDFETNLHSFDEVKGYDIRALDDKSGRVDDLIIDDSDWQILYLIVDTSSWVPWSKKVILPIDMLIDINYANKEAKLNMASDSIKNAPEFDSSKTIDVEFERSLEEFYDRIKEYRRAS